MKFTLSQEQDMFRQSVRAFAENRIAPNAREVDHTGEFPMDNFRQMAALGLLGIPFPEEYGGSGGNNLMYAIGVEEVSRACGSTGLILLAHTSLGCAPIDAFGTEKQKHIYLTPLARGQKLGAFGLTEAGAGSDVSRIRTTARLDGDSWIINGTKSFITNGAIADVVVLSAVTEECIDTPCISNFIIEKGTPGFSYGKEEAKMGLQGSATAQLFFTDCRIPKENILGRRNAGFTQCMSILDGGRISIGAMALGIAQGAFDRAVRYSLERRQFNKPIADFQAIQFKLAHMATWLDAARLMVYRAAWLKDNHMSYGKEAAMAKLYASEIGERVCHQAIQIHGGNGYGKEYEVERMYRDVRLTEIGEGTSEIQRLVIARHLLKEAKHI